MSPLSPHHPLDAPGRLTARQSAPSPTAAFSRPRLPVWALLCLALLWGSSGSSGVADAACARSTLKGYNYSVPLSTRFSSGGWVPCTCFQWLRHNQLTLLHALAKGYTFNYASAL